jgi:hypothetical protein
VIMMNEDENSEVAEKKKGPVATSLKDIIDMGKMMTEALDDYKNFNILSHYSLVKNYFGVLKKKSSVDEPYKKGK